MTSSPNMDSDEYSSGVRPRDPWAMIDETARNLTTEVSRIGDLLEAQVKATERDTEEILASIADIDHRLGTTRRMVEACWSRVDDMEGK